MIQIKEILNSIVDYAYKDDENLIKYQKFYVEIIDKDMKSKHGDYCRLNRHIRVFNLYRDDASIIATTLHELAHHVDFVNRGTTDHGNDFYEVFQKLLFASMDMEILDKQQIMRAEKDASDSNKIHKMIKDYNPEMSTYQDDYKKFIVRNCYKEKDSLKSRGYKYNSVNYTWEKDISNDEVDIEANFLKNLNLNYEIQKRGYINFEKKYFIIAGKGSYEVKEKLKDLGFKWKNKEKSWVLEVSHDDYSLRLKTLKEEFPDVNFSVGK